MRHQLIRRLVIVAALQMLCTTCGLAGAQEILREQVVLGMKYTIRSEVLGDDRSFIVSLPEGYESTKLSYPVLYILDAEYFCYPALGALRFLSECGYNTNGPVPQMILVAVLDDDRNRDFTPTHAPIQGPLRFPTSGRAAEYLEHMEKELKPFIDTNFRTTGSILSGWSLGGLFTFFTFLEKPDLFAAYVAVSPSLWWNGQELLSWADERIQEGARFEQRLVITQGSLEGGDIGNSVKNGIVPLLERKKATGWEYVEIAGESHNYGPYEGFHDGLRAAYPGFAVPQGELAGGLAAIKAHYDRLSADYGYTLDVQDSVYGALVRASFGSREPGDILPITAEWTRAYPHSALAWYFHGRLHQLLNDPGSARMYLEKALELEQARILPDSEWLTPMESRVKELAE